MSTYSSVRPCSYLCPILGSRDDQHGESSTGGSVGLAEDDEVVDKSLAMTGDPIIGMDKVMFD